MTRRHDPTQLVRAPELRHLVVLLETLRASEQDLMVEWGAYGFDDNDYCSRNAAGDLIDDMRRLRATIRRYRRRRLHTLRLVPPRRDDSLF